MRNYLLILSLFFCSIIFAQNTITGSVTNINNQPILGANIQVIGDKAGTVTDGDGKFTLNTSKNAPLTIEVTSVGYESKRVSVTSNIQNVSVKLTNEETQLSEVVVSASRTPERILVSPVTIERMGIKEIKKTASPSFYDGLENLKEVQMNTSSLTFKSINTRGFATVANTRFLQLVDGADNSSPLLNFVLGNLVGVSEIDVQSVELLPGASSALYGANAFNGILFMNSKSPFTYQGISTYLKYGETSQKAAGTNEFHDFGIRMAHAFNKYFAAKANFTYLNGTDWFATNYDDKTRPGVTRSDKNYDGINVYGDEVSANIYNIGQKIAAANPAFAPLLPTLANQGNVSRTGYNETDLTNNKASNTKIDFSLHFRPLGNENLEIIWQSKFGYGNAVYQGGNRYYLNNFFMQQHKLEIKGKNFFVRGYTTTEDGGKSYDMQFTGWNVNRKWKSDSDWFTQYAVAYAKAVAGLVPISGLAGNSTASNAFARSVADTGRLVPGTAAFQNAFNQVIADPSILTGSKLVDNSKIYHSDANYNFKDIIKFAEIQVGGSYREYQLNSHGRIYTDAISPINYNEYGAYTQLQKKFINDRLKFTGSLRYDKSKNFAGSYSPRISFVYSGGENKQHNYRGSFQTGFRNPSTQDQYIGFNVGPAALIGSAPDNLIRFSETLPVATAIGQVLAGGATKVLKGLNAYNNSYTASSVGGFSVLAGANPVAAALLLRKANVSLVKPEEVKAFELGYRSQIRNVNIDINGYYNVYNNFIGNLNVITPYYGTAQDSPNLLAGPADAGGQSVHALANGNYRVYQLYTNTDLEIKSLGAGIGLSKKIFGNYEFGINYNYSQFNFDQAKDPSFEAGFNTPKHRVKASIGNEKLFDNFGFNASVRWNNEYLWQSTFADGLIASATVIDAQINYSLPKLKSVIKLGAANLGGKEYTQVLGAGAIGHQYFVSWTINP
ncbi:TonB-dependent receptor [Flavobacterium soyangense]|uniref:TonB-dependent receptor n=1 Tax=Flavobacterium soyangense TaxID=2023265 RepID=A0A930UAC7_9FLAO|nr:TonB-dependent receptor [Flavobacterium soyangense]MBF2707129.1 TonB-dependent receptor [Flavobacterium soyangense]